MSRQTRPDLDHVGRRIEQWRRELPDVDVRGMAVLGRARWITLAVRPPIERAFAEHGLDSGEFDVLATLLLAGHPYRLRPTELFKGLMISSGGLTARLAKLERAGLIERVADEDDRRSIPVGLTARGRTLATAALRDDMSVEAELLAGLSDDEQAQLAALLAKLALSLPIAADGAG
jgi:DNA-binding MarR family transcriptional regulator